MKLAAVRRFALSLPEVTEQPHHHLTSFRVRGKIFVTAPATEEHIHVFIGETEREQALALYPGFLEKLFWGGKAMGLRVRLVSANSAVVKELVRRAWANKAPKAPASGVAAQ